MNEAILDFIFGLMGWVIFIVIFYFSIKRSIKNMADKTKASNSNNSTQFTLNGKTYNNLEEYFGKYKKRTQQSLNKVFKAIPGQSITVKKEINISADKAGNIIRCILFIIVVLVLVGMIYYYFVK